MRRPASDMLALVIHREDLARMAVRFGTLDKITSDIWRDHVAVFGKIKANAMRRVLMNLTAASWAMRPRHRGGGSVVQDAKTIRKDFLAAYPYVPRDWLESLLHEYVRRNR